MGRCESLSSHCDWESKIPLQDLQEKDKIIHQYYFNLLLLLHILLFFTLSLNLCLSGMTEWHQWLPSLEKYQEPFHPALAKIHRLPAPNQGKRKCSVSYKLNFHDSRPINEWVNCNLYWTLTFTCNWRNLT